MSAPTRLSAEQAAAALADAGFPADAAAPQEFGDEQLAAIIDGYLTALHTGETTRDERFRREYFVDNPSGRTTRYVRISERYATGGGGAVHAFIDSTDGSLHKPGGLKGPAKNRSGQLMPRYQLADAAERDALFASLAAGGADYGGYLYARH